jgi:MFS transporter, DHA1 family, tetracycline resistance protein
MRKPSLLVIWLTVFIDLIGFGIVVPLVPLFGKHFGAHGFVIGLIIASFSAMQFVFAPIWGRLSDRIGRRPVLLGSTLGAALSYAMFALSCAVENHTTALWLMVLSRSFAGICGGNITVAQAYIADITPQDQRSRKMGLIGMAFGLGFIFGPVLGGVSWKGFSLLGFTFHGFGPTGPGWVAAALCAVNFLLAVAILTESRTPSSEPVQQRPHLDQWRHTLTQPKVGLLVIVFFLSTFCFSCFESTLPLLISDNFRLEIMGNDASAGTVTKLFAFCGIIGAFVQGGAIGYLVKRMGEPRLIFLSLVFAGVSLAFLPFIKGEGQLNAAILLQRHGLTWILLLAVLALLAIGTSLTRPPLFGLLSNLTPAHEQGATLGVAQSAGSLARILGPIFATTTLHYQPALPYLVCTAVLLGTCVLVVTRLCTTSNNT